MVKGKSPPLRLGLQVLHFCRKVIKGYLFIDGIFEQRGMENRSSNGRLSCRKDQGTSQYYGEYPLENTTLVNEN